MLREMPESCVYPASEMLEIWSLYLMSCGQQAWDAYPCAGSAWGRVYSLQSSDSREGKPLKKGQKSTKGPDWQDEKRLVAPYICSPSLLWVPSYCLDVAEADAYFGPAGLSHQNTIRGFSEGEDYW